MTISKLPTSASLKEVIDKFEEISLINGLMNVDIISSNVLPSEGRDGQVCIITDNPTNNIILSQFEEDNPKTLETIFVLLSKVKNTNIVKFGIKTKLDLYFLSVCQGDQRLDSYIYKNGEWVLLTKSQYFLLKDKEILNTDIFGNFILLVKGSTGSSLSVSNGRYKIELTTTSSNTGCAFDTPIDLSSFSKFVVKMQDDSNYEHTRSTISLVVYDTGTSIIKKKQVSNYEPINGEFFLDISDINVVGRVGILLQTTTASGRKIFVTEMSIM